MWFTGRNLTANLVNARNAIAITQTLYERKPAASQRTSSVTVN